MVSTFEPKAIDVQSKLNNYHQNQSMKCQNQFTTRNKTLDWYKLGIVENEKMLTVIKTIF